MTSLPQPALTKAGFNWIVCADRYPSAAFAFLEDAVKHAKERRQSGARVSLGHTVWGWFDFFDASADVEKSCGDIVEWSEAFRIDPWHMRRFVEASAHGKFSDR